MSRRQRSGVLNRLAGKKLVFSGKFSYGVEDALKALAEAQQGTVCDDLNDKVDYLVLADLSAGKTIQKKALTINGRGFPTILARCPLRAAVSRMEATRLR
jgi:NAD-dependent DNA ligase